MRISEEELAHLETLARLRLDAEERPALRKDLSDILEYFEQIRDLDTEQVEELARPIHTENVFRDDRIVPSLPAEQALALAIERDDGFFRVPRTVEED